MARALNTMVYGSPSTCEEAADWLDSLQSQANAASDEADSAVERAGDCWGEPAHDAFTSWHQDMGEGFLDVADTSENWSRAFRDFAGTIHSVQDKMRDILSKARSGGLAVNGPFILAPENHIPVPTHPKGPFGGSDTSIDGYSHRIDAYNAKIDALNVKIELYNDLQEQVRDQRNREDQAHYDLRQAISTPQDQVDEVSLALTGVAGGRTVVAAFDDMYRIEMARLTDLGTKASALQALTSGKPMNEDQVAVLRQIMKTQPQDAARARAVEQWTRWIRTIPQDARDQLKAPTLRPGGGGRIPARPARLLSKFSYLGAGLTALTEARGAWRGEQSWVKAGVDTGAEVGGGVLGGRAGGAVIGGLTGGPFGLAAGVITGSTAGAKFAKDLVTGWDRGMRESEVDKHYAPIPEEHHYGEDHPPTN